MTQQQLSASQKLLLTLTKVEAKINRLEREPIAIIGMGCRFPGGAHNLEQFWQLLSQGQDAVTEVPPHRWNVADYYEPPPGVLGKTYTKEAAFLKHPIETFDPAFFGLTPIEAQYLDPRHRLLLEVAWEALEDAGVLPTQLPTMTGIFMGLIETETNFRQHHHEVYATTGGGASLATGRLSFVLEVQGPNMAIDTACSSSLVALHLACQSLRAGESQLVLCGGVQDLLSIEGAIALSGLQALAPDGRCKTFSAQANGYGRGEGCGMVVLKRLSDAVKDGDRIWAVIRGSAVNHDGPSSGLTVPNKVAQVALIRQALAKAQLEGKNIDYVEAHGTGTKLGDPIELRALHEALGTREKPLFVGSVKTNMGHLEAAAGIAGVIKVALSLYHQAIPPHLHFHEPSPHIDWANLPFQVPTALTPWPRAEQPRYAGISSFGISGTNAHAILGEAPLRVMSDELGVMSRHLTPNNSSLITHHSSFILTLSGRTEQALHDQVAQYRDYLSRHTELDLVDICYTAHMGRVHFNHRLAVVADNMDELIKQLGVKSDELAVNHSKLITHHSSLKTAFLFTGLGPQYADMGRELYDTQPLFRQIMTECDEILRPYLDVPLLQLLYGEDKAGNNQRLDLATYAQPALFAIEYALAKLWQSWGVEPEVVMGHSMGEYAAAAFAGVFSLADGLRLIAARGRLMQTKAEAGQMVAVLASAEQVETIIKPFAHEVSIGVINTPQNLVISGRPSGVQDAVKALNLAGLETRPLKIFVASHSPLMDGILDEFIEVVKTVERHRPKIKIVSNVTGQVVDEAVTTLDYWRQHLRESVRFAQGMATLAELGINTFIEVGPKPTLLGMAQQNYELSVTSDELKRKLKTLLWLPSLHIKQQSDMRQMLESLGQFYQHGGQIDWRKFHAPYPHQKVSLPTYPFQRKRYWPEQPHSQAKFIGSGHPFVGQKTKLAHTPDTLFQVELSARQPTYLADHVVLGQVMFPATAYMEMILGTGAELLEHDAFAIHNISFQQPLILNDTTTSLQIVFTPLTGQGYRWQIFSWDEEAKEWLLHATGEVSHNPLPTSYSLLLNELQNRCAKTISVHDYYQNFTEQGLEYRSEFQAIEQLHQGAGEALGLICLSETLQPQAANYHLHPALLDACLQISSAALKDEVETTYLPFAVEQVRLYERGHKKVWSYAKLRQSDDLQSRTFDLTLFDEAGKVVAEIISFTVRQAQTGQRLRTDWLYEVTWQDSPLPQQSPFSHENGSWLIITPELQGFRNLVALALADLLRAKGERVVMSDKLGVMSETYRGVIYFAASQDLQGFENLAGLPNATLQLSTQALTVIQQLIKSGHQSNVWFVTQNAVDGKPQTVDASTVYHLPSTTLWGLGKALMWEHPELACRCIDLTSTTPPEALFNVIWHADNENQIRLHSDGQRQVARLERRQVDGRPQTVDMSTSYRLQSACSYLITGGLGGLGLKVTAWLAKQGASHIVLSGRTVGTAAQHEAVAELERLGAKVLVVSADISQEADVRRLLEASHQFAPLHGIIHAAGVIDDGIILQQTPERFAKVFAPKVAGSWYLHQLSQALPLDFFVCFSSAASLLGNAGQTNYAAANAFMDNLMSYRRAQGLPGVSINWGGWSEIGLAEREKTKGREKLEDLIAPQQGIDLLAYILGQDITQIGVLPTRWANFSQRLPAQVKLPILSEFLKAKTPTKAKHGLRQQLEQVSPEKRYDLLKSHIQSEIEFIIGVQPTADQSFFDLGMDSLMSIQLGNQLATRLELSLPATLTLQYPTLNRLVDYLAESLGQAKNDSVAKEEQEKVIRPVSRDQIMPLSFVQEKVWARQQINPTGNLFNIWVGVELIGPLNLTWLTESLQQVAQRQETLRTTYQLIEGVVVPQIATTSTGNLTLIDLSHLPEPTQSAELHRRAVEAAQTPFNIGEQAWRVVLIKLTEASHLFVLCMHHMVMDAWSIALLFNEITENYKSLSEGLPAPLPPLEIQYADFAYWQRHYFTAERMASRLQYWQERLAKSAPLLELPIDKPRPPTGGMFPSNVRRFRLPVALSQQIKALSLRTGTTFFVTMLSAYMTFLHQLSGFEQIVTISPVNKRDSRALEPLIGHFSEMAILWVDLRGQPSFEELQQRVSDMVLEAINQQDVPLEQVVQTLLRGDNLTKDLPYRVMFNIIPPPGNVMKLPHIEAKVVNLDEAGQVKMLVDLALIIWEEGEGETQNLAGWWRYRTDLFETTTIDRFNTEFEALLNKLVDSRK